KTDKQSTLLELSQILIQQNQWDHAITITHIIDRISYKLQASKELGKALEREHQWERAVQIWDEFIIVAREHADSEERANVKEQAEALCALRRALEQAQQWQRAQAICEEAISTARNIEHAS